MTQIQESLQMRQEEKSVKKDAKENAVVGLIPLLAQGSLTVYNVYITNILYNTKYYTNTTATTGISTLTLILYPSKY